MYLKRKPREIATTDIIRKTTGASVKGKRTIIPEIAVAQANPKRKLLIAPF